MELLQKHPESEEVVAPQPLYRPPLMVLWVVVDDKIPASPLHSHNSRSIVRQSLNG